jgi:hypothetical protein
MDRSGAGRRRGLREVILQFSESNPATRYPRSFIDLPTNVG